MSKCETFFCSFPPRWLFVFFKKKSSCSPIPHLGYMPTIHVPSCHGGSFTLLPSLKYNYSWWRSNVSCVTDNQTAAKSIWCNWLRINCGTRLLKAPRALIVAFSSLGRSHTLEYEQAAVISTHGIRCSVWFVQCCLQRWWHLSSRTRAPLSGICLKCVVKAGTRMWPSAPAATTQLYWSLMQVDLGSLKSFTLYWQFAYQIRG